MPHGKKLCKSCSALNSFASKKCTTCGVTFDKRGIVVSIASLAGQPLHKRGRVWSTSHHE